MKYDIYKAVQYILNEVDLIEYLISHEQIEFKKFGSNLRALCPFHSDTDPSFCITKGKNVWYCFGCKAGGSLISFIERKYDLNRFRAIKYIFEKLDTDLNEFIDFNIEEIDCNNIMESAQKFFLTQAKNSKVFIEFFTQKGLDINFIISKGVGYSPDEKQLLNYLASQNYANEEIWRFGLQGREFTNSIIYPIKDSYGSISYFSCRTFQDAKYVSGNDSIPTFIDDLMFGADELSIKNGDQAIIVEGYNDALALMSIKYKNVLAMRGLNLSEAMVQKIVASEINQIYIWVDGDSAGWKFLESLFYKYKNLFNRYSLHVFPIFVEGKDPDQAVKEGYNIEYEFEQASILPIFFLDKRFQSDLSGVVIQSLNLIDFALKYCKEFDSILLNIIIQYLSKRTGFDISAIQDKLMEMRNDNSVNREAESNLLSCLLNDTKYIAQYNIVSDWFGYKASKYIFDKIVSKDANSISIRSMVDNWALDFLDRLPNPNISSIENYVDIVRDLYCKRNVKQVAKNILVNNYTYDESLSYLSEAVVELYQGSHFSLLNIGDAIKNTIDSILDKDHVVGYNLGENWRKTNQLILGICPRRLIILSGNTGHGKTTVVLNWIYELSIAQNYRGLLFSGEMDESEIIMRLMSIGTGIDNVKLLNKSADESEMNQVFELITKINSDSLLINSTMNFGQIINIIKFAKFKHDIKYVVIDYAQLIEPDHYMRNMQRTLQLKEMSRRLKNEICRGLDLPVILVSQQSDQALDDSIPLARRMSESKLMQGDADITIAMRMKTKKEIELDPKGNILFHFDKIRYNRSKVLVSLQFFENNLRMKEI